MRKLSLATLLATGIGLLSCTASPPFIGFAGFRIAAKPSLNPGIGVSQEAPTTAPGHVLDPVPFEPPGRDVEQAPGCTIRGHGLAKNPQNPGLTAFHISANVAPDNTGGYRGAVTINDKVIGQQYAISNKEITSIECFLSSDPNLGQAIITSQIVDKGIPLTITIVIAKVPGIPTPNTTVSYTVVDTFTGDVLYSRVGRLPINAFTLTP